MADTYDFIIVGAGSAGCLLANRLSENPSHHVLLIEAGGSDRSPFLQVPLGYARSFYNPRVNWMCQTEPVAGMDQRDFYWPRGKVLGGSSAINAVVYHRGLPLDYEQWAAMGNDGWSWQAVEPYFSCHEKWLSSGAGDAQYDEPAEAEVGRGEIGISDVRADCHHLCQRFIQANQALGIRYQDNMVLDPDGVGYYRLNTERGVRASSSNAFLRPIRHRKNLTVLAHSLVNCVVFSPAEGSAPARASGVEVLSRQQSRTIHARKRVILSAGAIGSPALLQRSGIGDAALLQSLDIPCVRANANVGQHLQDHLAYTLAVNSKLPTLNNQLYPLSGQFRAGIRYLRQRDGLLAMSVNQAGGLVRSRAGLDAPNLQLYFNPITYQLDPNGKNPLLRPDPQAAFSMSFNACRPSSCGDLAIVSPSAKAPPRIQPAYLSTEHDQREAIEGVKLLLNLMAQPAIAEVVDAPQYTIKAASSDEEMLDDFKAKASTIYHPVGTCRMGVSEETAVVSPSLDVYGVSGLKVVDASIFPTIPSANTNAPTMMVAEKAASMIEKAVSS